MSKVRYAVHLVNAAAKREAARRVLRAETLLCEAVEKMEKAQAALSVIVGGLNQNYARIGALKDEVKKEWYDLERCRKSGLCDLDETMKQTLGAKR